MPRDPLVPESSTDGRLRSPDTAGGSDRKRRRKVLSCYDCRRRKLQCDRAQPACGRCTKTGQAANCLYVDEPTDTPTRNAESAVPIQSSTDSVSNQPGQGQGGELLSRLEFQEKRIRELETALSTSHQNRGIPIWPNRLPLTPESIVDVSASGVNVTDRETMLLRGKSFKTQFHGISHLGSLIAYIPELSAFVVEAIERFPGLSSMRQHMSAIEGVAAVPNLEFRARSEEDLRALLPSKAEADGLIKLYLANYDNIYHIVHTPSFLREYELMWMDVLQARPHFVALVLLMMAAARCLPVSMESWLYVANSSFARNNALISIRACEDWLLTQSQKHVTVTDFQIRFLINLSKVVNAYKFKRTWTDAGSLLRFCMAAGLHRNPDLLRKSTSALDKELRRRIWLAVAEFELETAFGRGMISSAWPQQSDYVGPSNISDEEFDPEVRQLPTPRPMDNFTSASYLALANESFMLRYTLNNVLNNIRQIITFDEAKRFTEEIEAQLQVLPHWDNPESEASHALLRITLLNYMLVLHDRQIRQTSSPSERTFYKMAILDAAKMIIDVQKSLADQDCRVLLLLRHDQMRAALSVCHVLALSDPLTDSLLYDVTERCATEVINGVVELIADKISRLGCEQRQLWIVVAAHAFMKTKKDASQKLVYMQEAIDQLLHQFYKILAGQTDVASTGISSNGNPTIRKAGDELLLGTAEYFPINASTSAKQKTELYGGMDVVNDDPALLDFEAIAAWTFDDWTFDPTDFAAFDAAD